jgi:hypothetical protein
MCQKSQLVEILEALVEIPDREPKGDAIIIDGSALINALPPRTSKTMLKKTSSQRLNSMVPDITGWM